MAIAAAAGVSRQALAPSYPGDRGEVAAGRLSAQAASRPLGETVPRLFGVTRR